MPKTSSRDCTLERALPYRAGGRRPSYRGLRRAAPSALQPTEHRPSGARAVRLPIQKHRWGRPGAPLNRVLIWPSARGHRCANGQTHVCGQRRSQSAAGRWRRYAGCRGGSGRVSRCQRAGGRRQIHRHALGTSRRIRCRHHTRCRIDAGIGKHRDRGLNRTRRRAGWDVGGRERQSGAIGRRSPRGGTAYDSRWTAQRGR
jgi:hypothetical protein